MVAKMENSGNMFASVTELTMELLISALGLLRDRYVRLHLSQRMNKVMKVLTIDRYDCVLIQRSRISTISTDAFTGMSTVETVELFDNQIGMIAARAFASIVNLGRIRIARNHIETLQTVESLLSTAVQTRMEENTLECGCDLQWMTAHEDRRMADVNYCGPSGVHRTVRTYLRQYCHRPKPTVSSTLSSSETSFVVTNHDRMLGEPKKPSSVARFRLFVCMIVLLISFLL
ncbi:hypothetical protein COOONC_18063 [Cooperia oncophora]